MALTMGSGEARRQRGRTRARLTAMAVAALLGAALSIVAPTWRADIAVVSAQVAAVPVRVERGTMTLPTYEEGPPDVNPSFDLFATRFTYPYTVRQNLTIGARRRPGAPWCWRTSI